ncbi:MAG: BON domain-containing protein [Methyloligellaceae bacterium]
MRVDLEILDAVRAALRSEPKLGARFRPDRLAIDDEGTLTIEGEVPSVAAKKLALESVAALAGITGVLDRLRVAPAAPMQDAEIRAHLRRAFIQEPSFMALEIAVRCGDEVRPMRGAPDRRLGRLVIEIDDGIATLNGSVPGLNSKRLAGVLAWWVPGVRDVVNGLAVEPEEEDGPDLLEEAVRIALEKDPFVDATQIKAGVRHRVVRLTGLVRSEAEQDMAERDAWYVFGVDKVVNEIQVQP